MFVYIDTYTIVIISVYHAYPVYLHYVVYTVYFIYYIYLYIILSKFTILEPYTPRSF
jgi:hypothetical protein